MSTGSCEGLTLTEICIWEKKPHNFKSWHCQIRICQYFTEQTRFSIPLHTTFTGMRSFICITGLPHAEGGCVQVFCCFVFWGFFKSISKEIWYESFLKEAHVKQETLSSQFVQYTVLKLGNQLQLITQAKHHSLSCLMVSSIVRTCSWILLQQRLQTTFPVTPILCHKSLTVRMNF